MPNIEKHHFVIRTYGFGELAQKYLPHVIPNTASKNFRKWLKTNSQTIDLVKKGAKIIKPIEVTRIVDVFGLPECYYSEFAD